ncbi:MAG: rhodanese-like domain-containing protein [Ignavibacteria bacterium]|nr:MAG: rhodanese-like domain-containing protein [Ignavibacteria bacterium]
MNPIKFIIFNIILSAVIFVGCAQTADENAITVDQLREMMVSDSNFVLLDVRNPYELEDKSLGHIDGVLNIPVQELEERLSELDEFKNKDIAVICRSGRRSETATDLLVKNGFNAVNVLGGMVQYRATENKTE